MPACGSQVLNCNVPIRLDSYRGCGFACDYCLEWQKRSGGAVPTIEDTPGGLERFIFFRSPGSKRNVYTRWCDWDIPLHFGGISDPLQPCELDYGNTFALMTVLRDTSYPYILQTKGVDILQRPEYMDLLRASNVMVQVSMCAPSYDRMEAVVPGFRERLASLRNFTKVSRRVVVRCLPYTREILDEVLSSIPQYAAYGVYGLSIEGMKWYCHTERYPELTEFCGSSFMYPCADLLDDFTAIYNACHRHGMFMWCCDNRMRHFGDRGTCCGCDGLPGFRPNAANLCSYPDIEYTDHMHERGTGSVFRSIGARSGGAFDDVSYIEGINMLISNKEVR